MNDLEVWLGMGNLNNFKRPPHKILINYKVKK